MESKEVSRTCPKIQGLFKIVWTLNNTHGLGPDGVHGVEYIHCGYLPTFFKIMMVMMTMFFVPLQQEPTFLQ